MAKRPEIALVLALVGASSAAQAQVGEHARISTRSDVRMSIQGALGTGGKKLEALAKHLGAPLNDVKSCYAGLVKEHPDAVGSLDVELELKDDKKPATVRVPNAVGKLKPMSRCIDRAFGKLQMADVPRPAGAKVTLELTNSAAASVDEVRAREEEASRVEVQRAEDGRFVSEGQSTQGELSFRITSRDKDGQALVEAVHQGVRDAMPGLFDCRRRAAKKESPEGDIVLKARYAGSLADLSVVSSSVPNERAPTCAVRALKPALRKSGRGSVEIAVHFTPL